MKTYFNHQFLTLITCLFCLSAYGQTTLFDYGSLWSYYDNLNEPVIQGAIYWNDLSYDDSSWLTGNSHLGYGDGDEVTTINSSTLAVYVRHDFNVSSPGDYDSLNLNLTFDDGAIVYLNGTEVWRLNMPGGTVTYGTFSSGVGSENGTASITIANSLVSGNNVLAVEVHQASASSSDISFDFKLSANATGQVSVTRGPYLQKGSPTGMVVRWRTISPTESVIDYGTALGILNQNASDLTLKTEHEVEITGLTANTTYYYQISNASTVLVPEANDIYFKTHPAVGSSQPFTFWALGDAGTATNNQRAVRDAYYNYIGSNITDGILFLGDNAYNDGYDTEYQTALFDIYDDKLKNSVAWSTLGNHDGHQADSGSQTGPYYDIFTFPTAGESGGMASGTEAYYSFDYGNIHFIVLESYETDRSVGGSMYNWAQSDIQNTAQEWIIAIWHHPPYTKGSHNSDTETQLVQMRQNFLPMLETNGVDLILSGHSHSYERSYFLNGHYGISDTFNSVTNTVGANGSGNGRIDGTGAYTKETSGPDAGKGAVYITAGSSGKVSGGTLDHEAMYYSISQLGSCIIEVNGSALTVKFIRETGAIEDYFTIEKGCSTVGLPCDDVNACTTNDVYDANCDCAGTPVGDSDGDGVCDAEDQCPGLNDALIGTACDDLNACTINDIYDANCGCAGTFADADSDGVCDSDDICPGFDDTADIDGDAIPDGCDNCNNNLEGTPCDDGDACTTNDIYDINCGCAGTFEDTDSDGVCDADDVCPGFDDNLDSDGDSIPDDCDSCDNNLTGTPCNDGDECTINDVYDANCGCVGTFEDSDGDGVCDLDDICPGFDDTIDTDGDTIPDGCDSVCVEFTDDFVDNPLTHSGTGFNSTTLLFQPDSQNVLFTISGISQRVKGKPANKYIERVDVSFVNGFGTPQNYGTFSGASVSSVIIDIQSGVQSVTVSLTDEFDGNSGPTMNISFSQVTYCINSIPCTPDSDGDGVCDEEDQCPGTNDALIGTLCDDADSCTVGEIYDSSCNCSGGIYTDNDGDGLCIGDDPDDNDGCNPDPNSGACSPCSDIISDSFENGFGNWNDGGTDAAQSVSNANTGVYSIRLRDDSGNASSIFSNALDLSPYNQVSFEFSYITNSMENGEDFFLEISGNGGSSYSIVQSWVGGTHFSNNVRFDEVLTVSGPFTSSTVFRIRCDASGNNDQVYIDDVIISDCISQPLAKGFLAGPNNVNDNLGKAIKIYPNPASRVLFVEYSVLEGAKTNISIFSITGQIVRNIDLNDQNNQKLEIDLDGLANGLYLLRMIDKDGEVLKVERIIVK